ncbi:MAG: hypothetical protein MZV70_18200 [Desulfobacterales bacterium]|nr:hypothetical protein [Desulfobacterales bacterium]
MNLAVWNSFDELIAALAPRDAEVAVCSAKAGGPAFLVHAVEPAAAVSWSSVRKPAGCPESILDALRRFHLPHPHHGPDALPEPVHRRRHRTLREPAPRPSFSRLGRMPDKRADFSMTLDPQPERCRASRTPRGTGRIRMSGPSAGV